MSIQMHKPLDPTPGLMSEALRRFWEQELPRPSALKQTRVMALHAAMNTLPRPTSPGESIGYGYQRNNKFHDREPAAIREFLEQVDPSFFDSYPRRASTEFTDKSKEAAIGEAARAFYRHGLAAYGKPLLRSDAKSDDPLPGM